MKAPSTRPTQPPTAAGGDRRPIHGLRGADGIADDLSQQLGLMANRAAPYRKIVASILQLLGDRAHGPALLSSMQRAWRSRDFLAFYERPLLLLAALRSDALADGPSHPLYPALRDADPDAGAVTEAALIEALHPSRTGLWTTLALRRVQTNETSRALAWLWPAAIAGCSDRARPLVIVDVGCSAGLNLVADTLPHVWTTTTGTPLPIVQRPRVVVRIGIDDRPLDATRADDAHWLRACVWPGETERLERLDAALARFRDARERGERIDLVRRDATAAPALVRAAAAGAPPEALTIVYQTMMSGYLGAQSRSEFEAGMHDLVASAPVGSVLWVDLEVTGPSRSPRPAELRVHARDGDRRETFMIGATGYHPAEIAVQGDAVRNLAKLFAQKRT